MSDPPMFEIEDTPPQGARRTRRTPVHVILPEQKELSENANYLNLYRASNHARTAAYELELAIEALHRYLIGYGA